MSRVIDAGAVSAPNDPASGALPAAAHIGRVRLRVAEMERALGFYRDVLGLRATRAEGGTAVLGAGEGGPMLIELHERPGAQPASRRAALGLYHFAILVPGRPELGRVLRRLADAGIRVGASDHAVSEALYMSDPDGNGVEIYRDRPRSEWERSGGELHMVTAPLDLPALLRDAAPARPEIDTGTTIGHIHLHVGDLGEADRFFRDALGMELTVGSYPGARFYAAGGYHHHVGANTWAGASAPRVTEADAGLIDWELVLPTAADADRAADRLRAAGFDPARGPAGGWSVRDPAGTRLRLRLEVREG